MTQPAHGQAAQGYLRIGSREAMTDGRSARQREDLRLRARVPEPQATASTYIDKLKAE